MPPAGKCFKLKIDGVEMRAKLVRMADFDSSHRAIFYSR